MMDNPHLTVHAAVITVFDRKLPFFFSTQTIQTTLQTIQVAQQTISKCNAVQSWALNLHNLLLRSAPYTAP